MEIQFIKVKTVNDGHHIINVSLIIRVSPKDGDKNKSEIVIKEPGERKDKVSLYSTETPNEIFEHLKDC